MDKIQTAVSRVLRDTETCIAAAEVRDVTMPPRRPPEHFQSVLAVVTHSHLPTTYSDNVTAAEQEEEGCLFVLRYKSSSTTELYPYLFFPIDSDLTASLQQRGSADGTEFEVALKAPRGSIALRSNQVHSLSAVLEETRRLKKLRDPSSSLLSQALPSSPNLGDPSDVNEAISLTTDLSSNNTPETADEDDGRQWEWLHFYSSYRLSRILPSQQPKPQDIRFTTNGYKLSASSAGLPGDEDTDMALIRDLWVQRQLSIRKDEYTQHQKLRLRIGTFNVNGKPPSQSLVPWIWASAGGFRSTESKIQRLSMTDEFFSSNSSEDESKQPSYVPGLSSITIRNEDTLRPDPVSVATSSVQSSLDQKASENTLAPSSPPLSVFSGNSEDLPDIFVLGFQELDLSTEALLYSTSTWKEDAWVAEISDALGKDAENYIKLASKQLVGVLVVIIIRKDIQFMVKEVGVSAAGVGLMGIMGNKGATAIRLCLNSTTVTFVCSHLAAFDDYVDKRNSDFAELARKLEFPVAWKGSRSMQPLTANIWETDLLFWLVRRYARRGLKTNHSPSPPKDLNYRIDLPDEEVRMLLTSEPYGCENRTLLEYDQLKTAIRGKRAFVGFLEHEINFLPTYRYAEGPTDQLSYDLKRKPAWTDRILYLAADPTLVSQKSYMSHPTITLSDHQPVSADFDIILDNHDPHVYHRIANSIFKKLGNFEDSQDIPTVSLLDGADVELGQVSYSHPVSRCVRVRNEGKVACAFRFIPLDPGVPISKEWLQLKPLDGILLPGDTVSIHLRVSIDKRTASFLNHGNTRLEDILVLHLAKGTDHLISVSGSYKPTCFANSLAWLVRSPGPIRTQGNVQLLPEANTLSAPRELMFLIEWLITNARDVEDLFLVPARESLVSAIREHLDTQPLDSGTPITFPGESDLKQIALAFGATLLQFLDSLTEPVIPWVLHPRCALAHDREDVFEVLDHVPGFARNVYVTVTAFLHFIAQSGGSERSGALARVFADVLLRDNPGAPSGLPQLTPLGKRNFLLYTIS